MMRSTRSLRLSAFVLFALGSSALAGPAEDLSRAAMAALPGLQIGSGTVGESRDEAGAAVLANITYSSTGDRPIGVKIASVTVTGGIGATDALANSRVVLQGVEGTGSDGHSFKIDRVEIAGAQGSLGALLGSLATREPFFQGANEATITGYSAQSITVPSLTMQRRRDGKMEQAAYRDVRLTNYQRGRIGELVIGGIVTSPTEGQTGSRVEIATSRFIGLDTATGVRTGNATAVALESGSLGTIRGTGTNGTPFSIESITFGKISTRPGERSLVALSQAMQEIDPSSTNEETRRRSMGLLAELLARLDIERVEMAGFRGQTEARQPVVMNRFAIAGVSQGKIASFEFAGMQVSANNQDTSVGRITVEGIDATGLLALAKDFSEGRFSAGQPVPPTAYPDIRRVLAEDIDVKQGSNRLAKVGRFEVESGQRIGLVPSRLRAKLTGFEAPITGSQRAQVAPIGLTNLVKLTAEIDLEYVDTARELRARNITIEVDDVGSLKLVTAIGGLERAQIEGLPNSAAVLGLSAKAGATTLTFTEDGGIAALIAHSAQQAGVNEDDFKEQLKEQATALVGQFIQDRTLAENISEAIGEFIDDPSSLAITLKPKGDIPLAALAVSMRGSPFAVLPMFNIEVKANE